MMIQEKSPNSPDASSGERIVAALEEARKERGLSLEGAERATGVRRRYLEGLENDKYSSLRETFYIRGFLETYADYLGLDGDELSHELGDRHRRPRGERKLNHEAGDFGGSRRGGAATTGAVPSESLEVLVSVERSTERSTSRLTSFSRAFRVEEVGAG